MHPLLLVLLAAGGPLGLRTQGPLRELFLDMTAADARPIERPDLDVRWTVANTWNEPMQLVRGAATAIQELDEQADSISVRLKAPWPWARRVWTSLEWKLTEHWGGWSDRPIEMWHSLIGAFNYDRSLYPRDRVRLLYADSGGTAFDVHRPTLAAGDLTARTQVSIIEAPLAIAARFDFKVPVGSLAAAGGSGGLDAGVGLVATWPFASWGALHGLLGLSRFSHLSTSTALQPKDWHLTAEASFEAEALGLTFLLEDRVLSPLLEPGWSWVQTPGADDAWLASGMNADFRSHNQISLGIRWNRLSLWMSEDFTPGSNPRSVVGWLFVSNAPDIVLGLSFTQPL